MTLALDSYLTCCSIFYIFRTPSVSACLLAGLWRHEEPTKGGTTAGESTGT